jgi:membrane fusion protein, copper/silver efflux system
MNQLRVKLIIGAVAVLILGVAAGYWIGQRKPDPKASAPDASAQVERKVLYWHDPMVPSARFDKPGKSPFMDMQLVPVYADEAGGAAVSVSPVVSQNLGIRLGIVEKAVLQPKLRAVGSVAFDERLLEVVQARVEGYVTRLHVKAPLERVRRGQRLADIVAPAWLEAQEEYLALLDAQSGRGQAIRDAARQRLTVLGVPERTIRELDAQRKTNASATLTAPIDGVATELAVREGAAFMPGAALFRINGLKTVWVNAQVPEAQVSMIPTGSSVTARATAWPGAVFKGGVAALLPEVDPQTRTLLVRVVIENPEFKLAPGMFVSLDFEGTADQEQLVVPSEAVIMTGERNVVIVAREGGGFDVAEVSTGAEAEGKTAILSGLEAGQSIVLSGQFLLDSEASLKSTVSRLSTTAATKAARDETAAQTEDARSLHLTEGIITAIAPEAITIAHGPVPSLKWGAMTMSFKPPTKMPSAQLKVGDRVSFSFAPTEQGQFQIDSITLLDEPDAEPRP